MFIYSIYLPPFIDQFAFCVKFFMFLVAIYFEVRLLALLLKNSGHPIKYDNILRGSLLAIVGIFTLLAVFNSYALPAPEIGMYVYRIDGRFYTLMLAFVLSLFAYMFFKSRNIFKVVKDRRIIIKLIIAIALFTLLTWERHYSNRPFLFLPFGNLEIILDLIFLFLIILAVSITLLVFPDIAESINAYFSVSSLYIIKDNGSLLYSYHFGKKLSKDVYSAHNLFLAGFIFTITKGLESAMGIDSELRTLDYGENKLLLCQGEFVFGVILCSDHSPLIEERLNKFIKKFETTYTKELKEWKGKVSFLEKGGIEEEILSIFK